MEQVVLTIHLILAVCLIIVVLLQRSEGGALGIGGGGGLVSGRSAATALSKVTWGVAIAFIATSLTLTVLAAQNRGSSSVLESLGTESEETPAGRDGLNFTPRLPDLGDGPAAPPPGGPVAPPPAE